MSIGIVGLLLLALAPASLLWVGAPGGTPAALAFLANLVGLSLVLVGVGFRITGNGLGFALSSRNTYSLSRLQMGGWTVVVFGTLATMAEVNLLLFDKGADSFQLEIPGAVLAVTGIAGLTTALTPAILSLKATQPQTTEAKEAAKTSVAEADGLKPDDVTTKGSVQGKARPEFARLRDLISGDEVANAGTVDISKVQNLLLTGLLLFIYAFMVLKALSVATTAHTTLPDFSEQVAQLLGISHAAYLGYKAAPKPGRG